MCKPPKKLKDLLGRIQDNALSPLGFDQKIYTELRIVYARYKGIGMFGLNISCNAKLAPVAHTPG